MLLISNKETHHLVLTSHPVSLLRRPDLGQSFLADSLPPSLLSILDDEKGHLCHGSDRLGMVYC